jgi:hypothetical protein
MPPANPTALLLPHSAPLIADDASDLIKDATLPSGAPVRVDRRFAEVWETWNRFVTRGDADSRDATQPLIKVGPVTPCGVELASRHRPGTAPQCRGGAVTGPGSPEVRGPGIVIDPSGTTDAGSDAVRRGLLGIGEPEPACCAGEWQPQAQGQSRWWMTTSGPSQPYSLRDMLANDEPTEGSLLAVANQDACGIEIDKEVAAISRLMWANRPKVINDTRGRPEEWENANLTQGLTDMAANPNASQHGDRLIDTGSWSYPAGD